MQFHQIMFQRRQHVVQLTGGDELVPFVMGAEGVELAIATETGSEHFIGSAPVDFEYIIALLVLAPVPAGGAAVGDAVTTEAFQPLPIVESNKVVWYLDNISHGDSSTQVCLLFILASTLTGEAHRIINIY